MRKFAVIDVGSNSVRLLFVADGKVLYKVLQTTRLGEGLAQSGVLNAVAIERSARAIAFFYEKATSEGAEEVFAFATAAVRSAKNKEEFLTRVAELCSMQVEVLSGEEEAEIGAIGALGTSDGGICDVGGASTEIVVKREGKLVYKKSVDIGVVRLKDLCGRDKDKLLRTAETAAENFSDMPKIDELIGIGGTATTLAALALRLEKYSGEKITGAAIGIEQIRALADKLSLMTVEEIAALPCVPKGRADVLSGGAVWLSVLMQKQGIQRLIASDTDNLEGYALKKGLL
ncbi:MAG: hypothetical protein E7380_03510 [Clostridiales bacterium]|nr:hypothetical protein [Clostridiales bacterium]